MVITTNNICYYLLDRKLIDAASVVEGDFVAVETSRRNRNIKIMRKRRPGFFVKQIQNWDPQSVATLQCEATCYWLAQSDPEMAPLSTLMPKYYLYDPSRHILITELLAEGENLSEYHRRLNEFPVEIGIFQTSPLDSFDQPTERKSVSGSERGKFSTVQYCSELPRV